MDALNGTNRRRPRTVGSGGLLALLAASLLSSCAVFSVGRGLQSAFAKEEDPALAAEALPTLIKASEALSEADPRNQDALVQTASLYVMYGSGFLEGQAEELPDSRFEERNAARARALALYRRAFRLLGPALERRAPGLLAAFAEALPSDGSLPRQASAALGRFGKRDLPLLYWSAASILAAYGADPLEIQMASRVGLARALLERALAIDPEWDRGSLQELALTVYASFPDYLGGSPEKAETAYRRGLAAAGGGSASLHVAYAATLCVSRDDPQAFREALEAALRLNPAARPETTLTTVLAQRKAARMLARIEDYFLLP